MNDTPRQPPRHALYEDVLAFALGTTMMAFSVLMLTHAGLITGQTAGLAVLGSYMTGASFGLVFFLVNLPFYWLALTRMGLRFTLKTFIAVGLTSMLTLVLPGYVTFETLNAPIGALLAGACAATGLIVLFRHGASMGGIGIAALYLQDKTGFRAGWTQLIFDAALFALAFTQLPWDLVLYSLMGAIVVNLTIALNHRKDRYLGF
ncbi:YitT family protein [Mesobacterium pallidum]|uniref:YitT family protein n=1 Tax=Mesobacterium pallidum TaxID=2872037 RepID=UPI001EE364D4|nr:YitT family protein [Mesobacterium pallidum]